MIHLLHMIQNRRAGRPNPVVLPLVITSALGLLAGLALLLGP